LCNLSARTENQEILLLFISVINLVGRAPDNPEPTAEPGAIEILPSIDIIFIDEAVDFLLVDIETNEPGERASWGITSHHNVPGDRGVIRSDGRYSAPRLIPDPQTVQMWAKSGEAKRPPLTMGGLWGSPPSSAIQGAVRSQLTLQPLYRLLDLGLVLAAGADGIQHDLVQNPVEAFFHQAGNLAVTADHGEGV